MSSNEEVAFPRLSTAELAVLKPLATAHDYADGETVFHAGQAEIYSLLNRVRSISSIRPMATD